MKIRFQKSLGVALVALLLGACQPLAWQASLSLANTDVPVDSTITADPLTEAVIAPYRRQVTAKMSEVVGFAPVELSKGDYESLLGNFVVDLQMAQSQPLYGKSIDLSLTTNGGLRQPLPQGDINVGHVFELMPFENELVVLTLDGNTVQELFDYAVERKWAPIGGATYTIKNGKPTDIKIGGEPFDPTKSYTLVTSDYLAGGGDDLNMLKKASRTEKVGLLLRDAILQQIRQMTAAGQPITADTDPRVTVLP